MSNAILKLEFRAGTMIETAAKEAIKKAKMLDLAIEFNFNGVDLTVFHNSDVKTIVNRYHRELDNS